MELNTKEINSKNSELSSNLKTEYELKNTSSSIPPPPPPPPPSLLSVDMDFPLHRICLDCNKQKT